MAVNKILDKWRAKLAKGWQIVHEGEVQNLKTREHGRQSSKSEKRKWGKLSRDLTLIKGELKQKLQQQHIMLSAVLNQLRHKQLQKAEIVKALRELGVQFNM